MKKSFTDTETGVNYTVPADGSRLIPLTINGGPFPAHCHFGFEGPGGSTLDGSTGSGPFNITNQTDSTPVEWTLGQNPTPVTASTSASAVSSSTTTTTSSSSGSGGISGGAIAGIAIGAVVAVLLLGAVSWWLLRRRKQRKPINITPMSALYPMYSQSKADADAGLSDTDAATMEREAPEIRHEMSGEGVAHPVMELEATQQAEATSPTSHQTDPQSNTNHLGRAASDASGGDESNVHLSRIPHNAR